MSADGAVSPNPLAFTYEKQPAAPAQGTLVIAYVDNEGVEVYPQETRQMDEGTYAASDFVREAPEGYDAPVASFNSVTIAADSTATLTFTYAKQKLVTATVTIQYQDTDKKEIASSETIELTVGENQNILEYQKKIDGYAFRSVSSETVTVGKDGKANPAIVTFTYEKNATTASLYVHYVNQIGTDLAEVEVRQLEPGTHTVSPDSSRLPAGYMLSSSAQPVQVTVGSDLSITPNSVSFTCYDASVTAQVTVQYYDITNNQLITSETRSLTPGVHTISPDESLVKAQGTYTLVDTPTNTQVEVRENGTVLPDSVTFWYKPSQEQSYMGYLLVTRQTALRKDGSAGSEALQTLAVNTVLWARGQRVVGAATWHNAQTTDGKNTLGWVNDADVRRISQAEADAILEEQRQQENQPTQNVGYYITVMDSVPLRQYANSYASAKFLDKNTVVYVYGQVYDENGYVWHKTTHSGTSGYVRDGQLRKLTDAEVDRYRQTGNPLPTTPSNTTQPTYNPNAASSYGYVTSSGVNFRTTPSMRGARIKQLNRYAMALVIGTKEVDGVTWYNVNYSGTVGWIHGDYFHQMSLTEFNSFMGSKEYYQGVTNNAASNTGSSGNTGSSTKPGSGNTGSSTQGKVESVEDWNVGTWKNTGVTSQTSYAPFNPYATPSATATAEAQATASPEPTSTFVIGTMIPINYEDETKETQTSSVPWGLIGGAVVLLGGAGGVYAYALNQNKRRKAAAARAAASRRTAPANGGNGSSPSSPYARRAVAAPPASGTQQRTANQPGGTAAPYSNQNRVNPYGTTYANPYSTTNVQGMSRPSTQAPNPYAPTNGQNSAQSGGTSYGGSGNPYAAHSAPSSSAQPAQTGTNPYARPISAGSVQQTDAADTAQRARRSRMQRYHEAENENGKSENL